MMLRHLTNNAVLLILSALLLACDGNDLEASESVPPPSVQQAQTISSAEVKAADVTGSSVNEPVEIEWDSLVPADWNPDELLGDYSAADLVDDGPTAKILLDKLKSFWKEAPVVHEYDGKLVKLPGFVVPLETDAKSIQEFLLVPYYGACIHTPPPPANQTVYVVTDEGNAYQGDLFDTVWVTGTLSVEKLSSELGDAGYRIDARVVEPYQ